LEKAKQVSAMKLPYTKKNDSLHKIFSMNNRNQSAENGKRLNGKAPLTGTPLPGVNPNEVIPSAPLMLRENSHKPRKLDSGAYKLIS
jgi:hypothetical protein